MNNPTVTLTIFVACYNEEKNIEATLDTVSAACRETGVSYEIVVIDDASRDASVRVINNYKAMHPEVPIVLKVNEQNEGLGSNYVEAAFLGSGKWYRLVCGDNVEPKETLATIFGSIGKAELLIPYYESLAFRSISRRIISRIYTGLINLITGHRLHYYNGMPLTLRYYVMRWHSNSHGFGFQADLVARLLDRNVSYLEIPVRGQERSGGKSSALTFKNFCSVSSSLLTLLIRRFSKIVYGRA